MAIQESRLRAVSSVLLFLLAPCLIARESTEPSIIAGRNVNMVSGTEWPDGDPFLQRQNEPTIGDRLTR